jgi:hypothetical protein
MRIDHSSKSVESRGPHEKARRRSLTRIMFGLIFTNLNCHLQGLNCLAEIDLSLICLEGTYCIAIKSVVHVCSSAVSQVDKRVAEIFTRSALLHHQRICLIVLFLILQF